jgi:hypothetical protein
MKSKKPSLSKTALLLTIMLSVVLILGFAHESWAATFYVDNSCPSGDGTSGDPFCTIQEGIDAAGATVVQVRDGTYAEDITMKHGVDVVSAEPGTYTPTISGDSGGGSDRAKVTFSGEMTCNLTRFEIAGSGGAGIFLNGTGNGITATIDSCDIRNNTGGAGIRLNGVVKPTISNCNIYGNGRGGIVTAVTKGDLLESGSSIIISGNTIGKSGSGNNNGRGGIILNGFSTTNDIEVTIGSNTISRNTMGGAGPGGKGGVGIWLCRINKVNVESNTIFDNDTAGLVLVDVNTDVVTGYEIRNNFIYDHPQPGINIGGPSGVTIGPGNEIRDNRTGIAFYVELNNSLYIDLDPSIREASSGTVTIVDNDIYSNDNAGIAVIDPLTSGEVYIQFNTIHHNVKAGIAFFNECTALIEDNDIHTQTGSAGIFTGDWSGTLPPGGSGFDTNNNPALLDIRRNKVHGNRAGMRLDHASGTVTNKVTNNLVYGNSRGGIRFSGSDSLDSPFPASTAPWGIADITNNTVADNGSYVENVDQGIYEDRGGGIVYDDISDTAGRNFFDPPEGTPPSSLVVKNNISAYNEKAGIRAGCTEDYTVYNLLYGNYGYTDCDATVMNICVFRQLGLSGVPCWPLPDGVIFDDPLFVDKESGDYGLCIDVNDPAGCSGPSPAIDAGDPDAAYNDTDFPPSQGTVINDMGAYGGPDPITW